MTISHFENDMSLPPKPPYTHPCNHCGLCCTESLCEVGNMAFPGAAAPCPALLVRDGKALCGFVLMEKSAGAPSLVADSLGIGSGCSMPDDDTTDDAIEEFDRISLALVRARNTQPVTA